MAEIKTGFLLPIIVISRRPLSDMEAKTFEFSVRNRYPNFMEFFAGWHGGQEVYRIEQANPEGWTIE